MSNGDSSDVRLLTIDQGNSSAKITVWKGHDEVVSKRIFNLTIESILPVIDEAEIEGCAYCSVRYSDAKFIETLRRLLDGRLLVLTHSTPLPIGIRYGSRNTLGNDRVAAAVAAAILFKGEGVLVADAGTAITLDLVSPKGEFLGGNIAPGMRLRFSSLHEATSRLPLVSPEGDIPDFGIDTDSAIRSGVVGGMVSEIADAFSKATAVCGVRRIVLTGSDAPVLLPLLEKRGLPVTVVSDLVGYGLMVIFRYNLALGNI